MNSHVKYLAILLVLSIWNPGSSAFELKIYGNNHQDCEKGRQALFDLVAAQNPTINLAKEGMDYIETSNQNVFGIEETLPRLFGFYITHVGMLQKYEKLLPQEQVEGIRSMIVSIVKQNTELFDLFRKKVLKKTPMEKPIATQLLVKFQNQHFKKLMQEKNKIAPNLESNLPEVIKEMNEIEVKSKEDNPKLLTSDYSEKINEAYVLYNILNRNYFMAENTKKVVRKIKSDAKRHQNLTVMVGNLHVPSLLTMLNDDEEFIKQLGSEITVTTCLRD